MLEREVLRCLSCLAIFWYSLGLLFFEPEDGCV